MNTYTASRMAQGNRIFPPTITLMDTGVTIHTPGLFSGKEITAPYSKISAVKVNSPMIGYSDVIIDIMGSDTLTIHGFTAEDAKQIKSEILNHVAVAPADTNDQEK